MAEKATKITRIEIKGLWGRYDLAWDLLPDVNILAGANGSGKSTILRMVDETMYGYLGRASVAKVFDQVSAIQLRFGDIATLFFEQGIGFGSTWIPFRPNHWDFISTFDQELSPLRSPINGATEVYTILDSEIYRLEKNYLYYQVDLGKRMQEILMKRGADSESAALEVNARRDRFLEMLDILFAETGKTIDRENNEVSFKSGDQVIKSSQLSAGEKQILIILMTVLVQDNRPSILLMDEPEISLHIDWQKKLIGYIRELNPNCQVILATHSPAIIMEGWHDHVFEVRDLITSDRNAVPQ